MIVKKVIYINIALVILMATNYVCSAKHYKLCVTEDKKRSRYCDLLSSPDAEVNCIAALDSHDCAFKLKNQEADFAVFTAEQIAFVAPVINHYTEIIFKVQESRDLSTYKLRMGVVVEKDISLTTLKGKRYCHPGFGNSDRNDHVMKIFESQVVPRGNCSSNSLDIENELDSLTNFFGDNSCRPGMWTEDDNLEAKLRKQYGKLCANCYNPEKCSNNPSRNNHDEGALRCVTQRGGQVAYVSIDAVKEYFKVFGESAAKYSYMCRDGTKMDISVDEPCAWYEEPFDAIVALSEYATELQNKIKDWVNRSEEWYKSLKLVLKVYDHRPLISFNGKPSDYAKNVIGSTNIPSCERTIKWCTTLPLENSKCETLKRAAALHAIKPELSCVQADNVWQCLNKTKENENDILGIDTSLAYLAYKYYYVEPMKYQECREEDKYKTVAIVKTSTANSFVELEKKNACFPEFGGLAHITIFEKLKDMKKVKKACLDDDLMDQFFNKTCIPSVLPEVNDAKELGSANNYCSLCASSNCSIATKRSYFPDAKAIECLVTNPGSIAFINANSIRTILDDPAYRKFPEDQYRILCQDGQEMSLNKTVNNACSFGTFYNGLIVASKYLSSIHLKDIDLAFLKMDSLFGPNSKLWLFNMYGAYNGVGDLLFKGKVVKLASNTSESVSQLTGLMKSLEKCSISTERSTIDRPIDREMDLFLYSSLQETTTNLAGVDNREDLAKSLMICSKSSGFAVMASACVVPLTVSLSVFVIMS